MTVPKKFRQNKSKTLTSFDFIDIAEGTGRINYNLCDLSSASILTTDNTMFGKTGYTADVSGATGEVNFDVEFNRAQRVRGAININLPLSYENTSGGTATKTARVLCYVYHVDAAATATLMVSGAEVGTFTNIGNNDDEDKMLGISLTATQQHFKRGEKLRFAFDLKGAGANEELVIGHDPGGRTVLQGITGHAWTNTGTTKSKVQVPFLLNL